MNLRKNISRIITEYINNEIISLKDYLAMSDEQKKQSLPHEYPYFFNDFLIETDTYFERPKEKVTSINMDEPDDEVDMFDDDDYGLIIWLEENDKEIYDEFAQYLFDKITNHKLPIPEQDYPTWAYFDNDPELIKNQWLIHFTDNADGIAKDGFKYGVYDITKLGFTVSVAEFEKKYGGYNFAFTLRDFQKYGLSSYGDWTKSGYKYGNEAVLFNASGIKAWHHGDQEPQVIFYGDTARNIIPITAGEDSKFAVYNKKGKLLYQNDSLPQVVNWIVKNYQQYRNVITYR